MFKFKKIAIATLFVLTIAGIAAMMVPADSGVATQVDVIELMSTVGDLPVQPAPEI